jgi:DNA-binding winged helix-turn-helix (wHTH) protein
MRSQIDHILTPETERHFFQEQLLPPLFKKENITLLRVPHDGIRCQMNFFVKNFSELNVLPAEKKKNIIVDPNWLADKTPEGYFKLMACCLDPEISYKDTSEFSFLDLRKIVSKFVEEGFNLTFILIDFHLLDFQVNFFNNLHSLHLIMDRTKLHYIFTIGDKRILNEGKIEKYGLLGELLAQNLIHFPVLEEKDSLFIIKRLENCFNYKIPENGKEKVLNFAGGHPGLIRACLRVLDRYKTLSNEDITAICQQQWEINTFLEDIWLVLSFEEKEYLIRLVNEEIRNEKIPEFLETMRIITKKENSSVVFSKLFEVFARKQKVEKQIISVDPINEQIMVNGLPPKEKISCQEHNLLLAFIKSPGVVFSREKVSEILWNKDSFEKYSDWAIDQIIFQLRRKLEVLGVPCSYIQTIKGRGYRWVGPV